MLQVSPVDSRAGRGRSRARRGTAAVALLIAVLAAGIAQATAAPAAYATATTGTPTTAAPPATVTTIAAPSTTVPAGTAPTTAAAAAPTTTTVPAAPNAAAPPVRLFVGVTPPPPAPVVASNPAEIALAASLATQITAQSTVIDQLAVQFSRSQAAADAAAQQTAAATLNLAAAHDAEMQAQAQTLAALAALRTTAISVYLGTDSTPLVTTGLYGPIYQAGLAHAYSVDVIGTVADRVRVLRAAERRSVALRKSVADETAKAQANQAAAVAAFGVVQAETQTAIADQAALTATLAQVKGQLVSLLAAQQAGLAWQTYAKLGGGSLLDFTSKLALPALLPQVAATIAIATAQVGKPYVWGATGPDSFDCSGLMQWSWAQTGVALPRVAADQQSWATPVPISQIQPGDLVFFGAPAHHVGMYVGNGMMIDAPHTGATVEVVPIWWDELSGFGRVHLPSVAPVVPAVPAPHK